MKFWAHSDPSSLPDDHPDARWQPLNQHLRQVGVLAGTFAREANPKDDAFRATAQAAGLLHDLGKYTAEFQRKIRGEAHLKAPHSAHGAAVARLKAKAIETAFAIRRSSRWSAQPERWQGRSLGAHQRSSRRARRPLAHRHPGLP